MYGISFKRDVSLQKTRDVAVVLREIVEVVKNPLNPVTAINPLSQVANSSIQDANPLIAPGQETNESSKGGFDAGTQCLCECSQQKVQT
jgi:hypothetical protein